MSFLRDLDKIKYLLFLELSILISAASFEFKPFFVFIGIIFGITLFYLVYTKPTIAIHLLMFTAFVDSIAPLTEDIYGPSILVLEILLVVIIIILFIKLIPYLIDLEKIPKFISLWLPYLIWSLMIGLIVAVDKYRVISFWKNYFAGFFFLLMVNYSVTNQIQLKNLIKSLLIWGVVLGLLELKVLIEFGGFSKGLVGLFLYKNLLNIGWGQSNYLAAFFVLLIPLTIGYLIYSESKISKFYVSIALLIMFFSITLTLSRGGILALLVSLMILSLKLIKPRYLFYSFIFLIAIGIVLLLNPLTYVLIDRISSLEASGSFYSRINYYIDVWNTFLDHPLTGVGFGNLSYYAKFIFPKEVSPSAHNILLGSLGEVGIIGTVFYFSIFFAVLIPIYKSYRNETEESIKTLKWSFFISLIGALIHTLVEPTLDSLHFSMIFWIVAGTNLKLDLLKQNN